MFYKIDFCVCDMTKLLYFGHVMRILGDTIECSIMTGLVEGFRSHERPRRICWLDNITTWTGLSGASLLHAVQYETENSGHYFLIHVANRRQVTKAK